MKLFKRHKTKDKATCNVGIRECHTCENNLRCEECAYPSENETLKAEVNRLNKELHNQRAEKDIFKESYYSAKKKLETAKSEAIKEFVWRFENKINEIDFPKYAVVEKMLVICKQIMNDTVKEMVGE